MATFVSFEMMLKTRIGSQYPVPQNIFFSHVLNLLCGNPHASQYYLDEVATDIRIC
jgi:hypothetical protein